MELTREEQEEFKRINYVLNKYLLDPRINHSLRLEQLFEVTDYCIFATNDKQRLYLESEFYL